MRRLLVRVWRLLRPLQSRIVWLLHAKFVVGVTGVVREVKEETGLDVEAGRLVMLNSGFRTRMEVAFEARLLGGELRLDPMEILEARWCEPDALPEGVQPVCHPLVRGETTP